MTPQSPQVGQAIRWGLTKVSKERHAIEKMWQNYAKGAMRDVLVIHALHAQVMKDGVNCEIEKFVNDEQTGLDTVCRVVQVHMQVVGGKMQN